MGNYNIIPEGTKEIATAAFENNKALTSVVIPEGVRKIGADAFAGCEKLREVKISSTVRIIGAEAFRNCSSLVSISIPDGVEMIHHGTFAFCTSLEEVVLAKSVRCLDNFSFNQCINLKNIIIKNDKLVIEESAFGYKAEDFPTGLISKCEKIFKHMTDSALKKYILKRRVWRALPDETSSKIFFAKHGSKFLNYYGACMTDSQIMHLGEYIVEKLKETNAKKNYYNAAVAYMLTFNEVITAEKIKEIYEYVENFQNAESLIKKIKKNKNLQRKIESKGGQKKPRLTETDEIVKEIIDEQGLSIANIKCELRCKYGITADELPPIYDKNGKKLKNYVFAYLIVMHGRDDYSDCDLYENPGLRPEAAKVLAMIEEEKFQEALIKLADDYLLLPGKPIYNKKIYCLFFPLCRYANEENIIYMTDFYDERKIEPSMLPMASWYSETRAAWVFAEETKTLINYAKVRKMSANELRALSYLETDGDLETNKEALKKSQKVELFKKYLAGGHWKVKEWQDLYKEVNMLRELVEPLVWVQGNSTFAIDGEKFVDCSGNIYSLNKARIRLAHPMEMKKDEVEKWQNYLKERKLEPYFNQLGENVYKAGEIKPDRYKGTKISISELRGKEEHGITFTESMCSFGSASVKIAEFENEECIAIESFKFEKLTRKINHIIGQLDMISKKVCFESKSCSDNWGIKGVKHVENSDKYNDILVDLLELSNRAVNCLHRANIHTLYDLIERFNNGELNEIRNLGQKTLDEIEAYINNAVLTYSNGYDDETDVPREESTISKEVESIEIINLDLSSRLKRILQNNGITTVGDMLKVKMVDLAQLSGVGTGTIKEFNDAVIKAREDSNTFKEEYLIKEKNEDISNLRAFDKATVEELTEKYYFKTALLMEWYGISRQRIYQKLKAKNNKGNWLNREFTELDRKLLEKIIQEKNFFIESDDGVKAYLYNNRKDDCAFLCVNDVEIKCFYLKSLPKDLQDKICEEKLQKYDSYEISSFPMGETIYVLRKPYFRPFDIDEFRKLAQRRGMSVDEYTEFIGEAPYSAPRNITDDAIIDFFEKNLVNGKVYISSKSSNQWIRSYASRNGFTLSEFIKFYGYEPTSAEVHNRSVHARQAHVEELKKCVLQDNVVYLDTFSPIYRMLYSYVKNNGKDLNSYIEELGFNRTMIRPIDKRETDEVDMEEHAQVQDGKFVENIFLKYPLIGSYVFLEKDLENIYLNAMNYLEELLADYKAFKSPDILKKELVITLAVINYAKNWASEEEASFWKYISGQFGYRDNISEIRYVLGRCVEESMHSQNRFFLVDSNGKHYKSTIVVHALTTKKTWMYLFDFLFDFYKNNLNWIYMDNDPSIGQMVEALTNKLVINDDGGKNESIQISSNIYRFQEGIKKLILHRPKYSEKLFRKIIKRLDGIIRQEDEPAKTYEEMLVDEWIAQKMQKIIDAKNNRTWTRERKEVAFSYERIKAAYRLENEKDIKIVVPDIRVKEGNQKVILQTYYKDRILSSKELCLYGNELGWTIQGTEIDLKECQRISGANTFEFSIKIICDEQIIFDSEKTLYRSCIVFEKKNEINPGAVVKGSYTVVIPGSEKLEAENVEMRVISEDLKYGNYYFVKLESNFVISLNNQVLAIDDIASETIRVIVPHVRGNLVYVKEGMQYRVATSCDEVTIIMNEEDNKGKYVILLNGERVRFDDLYSKDNGANTIFSLPIDLHSHKDVCKIQIIDLNKNKLILNEQFIIADNILFEFSRLFFFSQKDYENAYFKYSINELEPQIVIISMGDEKISVPYEDGEFIFSVPCLKIYDSSARSWGEDEQYWIGNVGSDTLLNIEAPKGIKVKLFVDDYEVDSEPKSSYELGSFLSEHDFSDKDDVKIRVVALVDDFIYASYDIANIAVKERFAFAPNLIYEKKSLLWDRGYGFIGRKDDIFKLEITSEDGLCINYQLDLEEELITDEIELPLGKYKFRIIKSKVNISKKDYQLLAEGAFFVGDENELKFLSKKIIIEKVSFYDYSTDRVKQTQIKKIGIDNLQFVGMEEVGDDGELPIYTGTAFFINKYGERKDFSGSKFEVDGKKLMKINPVRIALLNESVLSLVDSEGERFDEGDGFYCCSIKDKDTSEIEYIFTDREYDKWNERYYRVVDLYRYTTESTKSNIVHTNENEVWKNDIKITHLNVINEQTQASPKVENAAREGLFSETREVQQKEIIEADVSERILVNAGPGTGKTWTLIEKIIYLVKNLEIDADTIQVLCFSRAAVEVIRKRIDQEIENDNENLDIKRIDVRTFDSFATQLLYWVRDSDYDLIPENFQLETLNYEERIQKFIEIVKTEPDLISECKHLVVDEVQDLVLTRAEMVLSLIVALSDECGVTLLGDACQAIYDYQLGDSSKSLEFYREIKKLGSFSFYSFSENHRQTSELISYSDGYRKHILDENIEGCQKYLKSLMDLIPVCKVRNLEQLNKIAMESYFKEDNVAILTRNNAQALRISGILREHDVEHCMQRRLSDMSFCSWIALVLNSRCKKTYSYTEFSEALKEVGAEGIDEIWDFVSDRSPDRRMDTKDILTKIKEAGTCRYLYSNAKPSRLTVSTIHRSKGREYDSVIILDELLQDETDNLEEHRVKYVAISRARRSVFRSSMKKLFFRTLEDRRCFSVGTVFKNKNKYLKKFEVGLKEDLNVNYFADADALQEWIRENADDLIGKEVYLSKQEQIIEGCVIYDVVLKEDHTIVGQTSKEFSWDLDQAIRQIKGLPSRLGVYDYLYPAEFHGIYITDITSEIALMRGNEQGIEDFGGLATWNTLQIEGYAKAAY